ncbi:acyltransferase family protein [Pseudobacteriovorax antillogorgiicola]|uniref:Peptidoglycan/LPS O-acetylase OafA/YrhL, contains acyltransferase and SGNH-hydrolase domains n=1 Tax=Pseudobacteriovorax antillogorgiicola TaxID=1513793 RepID=A0A1Y6CMW8_9BACT|nr:acyltransferase [Pseudobacteriovorax antillogorgiicola]TCS44829.1 peptidoglycan/LPS O-acetylase OafA/YrhL [Pseudobacteriovorax antillogorgiicola]SMF77160.1 Peptidoglycan/LPS O-acetylase OafA/YrhL, contains acyltransferase and SGNH-hydrolase domains [Pseudobacteriovorax antillogorgiicola]
MKPLVNPFPNHIPALDGIRGMAIFAVLMIHFFELPPTNQVEAILWRLSRFGMWGIDLFFVLSGFLITGILLHSKERADYFKRFFMRRFLRIFPVYYLLLFVIFILIPLFPVFHGPTLDQILDSEPWAWLYSMNLYVSWKGEWTPAYINHFWSLAVEEHFYLFWPFVVYFTPNHRLPAVCLGMMGLSFGFRCWSIAEGQPEIVRYAFTVARLDVLCLGAYLATKVRLVDNADQGLAWLKTYVHRVGPLGFLGVLTLAGAEGFFQDGRWLEPFKYLAYGLFISSFIGFGLLAKPQSLVDSFYRWRFFTFLGKYSYGIYLYHNIISYDFQLNHRIELFQTLIPNHTGAYLLQVTVGCFLSVGLAMMSYHGFEEKFLKLKKYF